MTKTANSSHEVELFNLAGEKKCSLLYRSIEDNKPVIKKLAYERQELSDFVINTLMIEFGEFDYAKFNKMHLKDTDLFGVIATDATFTDCEILESIVYACTLYGSTFKSCIFKNVLFRGVNLAASIFDNCSFDNCKFTSDHINHFTDLSGAIFLDCTLKKTIFDDIDLNKETKLPL